MQAFITGTFSYHNRGVSENRVLYGQDTAPEVPLEKITTKIGLFYGDSDFLAHPKDIAMLQSKMKGNICLLTSIVSFSLLYSVHYNYPIPVKGWKHGDYVGDTRVDRYIWPHILYLLKTVN